MAYISYSDREILEEDGTAGLYADPSGRMYTKANGKKYISLGASGLPQSAAGISTKIGTAVTPGIFMPQKNEAMTFS